MRIVAAVPAEPLPRSPQGRSAGMKLDDWLTISQHMPKVDLRVESAGELSSAPDIVESFLSDSGLLSDVTIPRRSDHALLEDIRAYWPLVMASEVPAIPILPAGQCPTEFPVFVRGRASSFRSIAPITSEDQLPRLTPDLIIRPYVEIERCGARPSVTKELRVHMVLGMVCGVEFLFPVWAAQHPTPAEIKTGVEWAHFRPGFDAAPGATVG